MSLDLYFTESFMQFHAQSSAPAFDDFNRLLTQADVVTSPAEIHGMLCGFVCVGQRLNGGFWIDILLKRLRVIPEQWAFVGLYDAACRQLSGLQTFKLLLPDEQHALAVRAEALSLWCEGFLCGLGVLGGGCFDEETSETVYEALCCIAEIAKLDVDQVQVTELDKFAYEQAIEFITRAIPLIYEEVRHCTSTENAGSSMYLH